MSTNYDLIRIKNVGDTDLVLRGNVRYTIPAGNDRIIPFTEAASWFGDPRLRNEGRDQMRTMAWRQIQNLWGFTEGMTYLKDRWDVTQGFKTWDDFKPKVEMYDMDGERVYFIIDDPDGEQSFAGPNLIDPAYTDTEALQRQMKVMEKQMADMMQLLSERNASDQQATRPEVTSLDAVNLPQPDADDAVTEDGPAPKARTK
jgi:hypothetical protein